MYIDSGGRVFDEGDESLYGRKLVFAAEIAHVYGVGEGFRGDERADADVFAVDGVYVGDERDSKSLGDKRGDSVFIR